MRVEHEIEESLTGMMGFGERGACGTSARLKWLIVMLLCGFPITCRTVKFVLNKAFASVLEVMIEVEW